MIKRNIILVLATNSLILSCSVATSLLSAWALGPTGRGELALVTLWPHLCMYAVSLGVPQAVRYWSARRPERRGQLFRQGVVFALVAGGAATLAAELLLPRWVGEQRAEVLWLLRLFLLNIIGVLLFEVLRGLLEGARQFVWLGAARLIFFGTQGVGYTLLWALGALTLKSATLTLLCSQAACVALALVAAYRWRSSDCGAPISQYDIGSYGLRSFPGLVTQNGFMHFDQVILASLATSTSLGLYAVAAALAEITATLASSVADALLPEVAAEQTLASAQLLTRSLRLTVFASALVLLPAWWAAPLVLGLFYGADFVAAADVLRVLLLASAVLSAANVVMSGLDGFGHPELSASARVISALVIVGALLWGVPNWGLMGAAWAVLLGQCVAFGMAFFWLRRRIWEKGQLRQVSA